MNFFFFKYQYYDAKVIITTVQGQTKYMKKNCYWFYTETTLMNVFAILSTVTLE